MADLDDFFAKKDKKKSKAKPKFLTAEELVKNLEDTKREAAAAAKSKKPEPQQSAASTTVGPGSGDEGTTVAAAVEQQQQQPQSQQQQQQPPPAAAAAQPQPATEEEWKEFEEEQRKDYTGLKIGRMTVNDGNDQSPSDGDEDSEQEENAGTDQARRSGGGPWKKVIPAEEVTQIPMEKAPPSSKVYISPALRMSQGAAPPSRLKARNRAAPDITNADYFPTLGAARPEEQRKKKNEPAFEEVRHGGRVQRVQEQTAAPVSVANRFQTLDEDDS